MPWGFEEGGRYNRREHIHARYGGQQQGGIITPARHALVIIIHGAGEEHGYRDGFRGDGVLFDYFGEGQVGDMRMIKGNRAIAEHSANGKDLLLFRKRVVGIEFVGEFVCGSFEVRRAVDRLGSERDAIVFQLSPLTYVISRAEQLEALSHSGDDLASLRIRAIDAAVLRVGSCEGIRTVYERSEDVRRYVLARAAGYCEACGQPAPFRRINGSPYLEPHHIRRVSDGGPDDPRHVISLCPNCHRRIHAGIDGIVFNSTLADRMRHIEP